MQDEKKDADSASPTLVTACAYCAARGIKMSGGLGSKYLQLWDDFCEAWRTSDFDGWNRAESELAPLEGLIHSSFDNVLFRPCDQPAGWVTLKGFVSRMPGMYAPLLAHLIGHPGRDPRYGISHGICPAHVEELLRNDPDLKEGGE